MAGIYIHIPYCVQKCNYCDFFKTTSLGSKHEFLAALKKEIKLQQNYLGDEEIATIYFGGGTPSVLRTSELESIIQTIKQYNRVSPDAEITLEGNPDDLREKFVRELADTQVNRISMGIQSFNDEQLKFLNRRHNKEQALDAVAKCKAYGIDNISIDLIYGIPGMSHEMWQSNIEQALALDVPHISAYHLIIEPGTVFGDRKKAGTLKEIPDDESVEQFELLKKMIDGAGYTHYEISNFAKAGMFSKHNTSYWQQKKYLGLGPSAHSYNIRSRQWNDRNLVKYINHLNKGTIPFELEELNEVTRFNEYLMTTLRTDWGSDLNYLKTQFENKFYEFLMEQLRDVQLKSNFVISDTHIKIRPEKWFISDTILAQMFWV